MPRALPQGAAGSPHRRDLPLGGSAEGLRKPREALQFSTVVLEICSRLALSHFSGWCRTRPRPGMAVRAAEYEAAGNRTTTSRKQHGEETWTYLSANAPPERRVAGRDAGYLYLRNEPTGTLIELDRGEAAASFSYREDPWGNTFVVWLRDLSICLSPGFAARDAVDILEINEGERFPRTVAHQVNGRAQYLDKVLGGLVGWQLTGRRGHVVLQGVWGVEIWLIGDGFVVLSTVSDRAMFVRQGISRVTSSQDGLNFVAMDIFGVWIESCCGEVASTTSDTKKETDDMDLQVSDARQQLDVSPATDDADRWRILRWLPPLPDSTRRRPEQTSQTPSHSQLGWLGSDWEPSSRPMTRYTHGSYASRPHTRGSTLTRWSAPLSRDMGSDILANLSTIERMAMDGIISIEQFEACKMSVHAGNDAELEQNLVRFQSSHHLEHRVNDFQSRLSVLRKEFEKAQKGWMMEMNDLHVGQDDLLLTIVRKIRIVELEREALGPPPAAYPDSVSIGQEDTAVPEAGAQLDIKPEEDGEREDVTGNGQAWEDSHTLQAAVKPQVFGIGEVQQTDHDEVSIKHSETERVEDQTDDEEEKGLDDSTLSKSTLDQSVFSSEGDFKTEKQLALEKLDRTLARLQKRIDDTEAAKSSMHEKMVTRQRVERKAFERQISDLQNKIKTTKELFRESKSEEERRKAAGLPDPRYWECKDGEWQKKGLSAKVLARPRAVKQNRLLLDTASARACPFEDSIDEAEFLERYGSLRGEETMVMLSNTMPTVDDDEGTEARSRDFVVGEFKESVVFTRPRVRPWKADLQELNDEIGFTTMRSLGCKSSAKTNGSADLTVNGSRLESYQTRTKQDPDSESVLLKKKLAVLQNVAITKSTRAATEPRSPVRHVLDYMVDAHEKNQVLKEKEVRAVFTGDDGSMCITEMPNRLDWTAHVSLGHERELTRRQREEKHELQRFAESETLRRFASMKERHFQKKLDLSDHSDGNKGGLEEQDCEVTNTELIEQLTKKHQGSWTWASKHMRKARAAKEHKYAMDVTKGQAPDLSFRELMDDNQEGFDYEAAARNMTVVLKRAIPSLSTVWNASWDLSEELFQGLGRLDSPKRRGLWSMITEADGIIPVKMRERASGVLVNAYRCYLAKLESRRLRAVFMMRMYIRLQCNLRMAVGRRVLATRRLQMASIIQQREMARVQKQKQERILRMSIVETKDLSEDDKVFWMSSQRKPVAEKLARRLLGLVQGDVAKAMGLAGFAPSNVEDADKEQGLRPPTVFCD